MRSQLGSLRNLTVQPATKVRYDKALTRFFDYLKDEGVDLPKERARMDDIVSEYVETLWSQGEGRALAADTVAGLQNTQPSLRGHLPGTWRLLKAWNTLTRASLYFIFLFMLHFDMALLDKQMCAPSGAKGSSSWQLSIGLTIYVNLGSNFVSKKRCGCNSEATKAGL